MKKIVLFTLLLMIFSLPVYAQTEEESTLHIKADLFKFFEDRIEFFNHAEIIKGDFSLISEKFFKILRVQGEDRTVEATQGIFVISETAKATAVELNYDLIEEKGVLKKEVHSLIKTTGSSETVEVYCDILDFQTIAKTYRGTNEAADNPVKIYKGEMYVECREFLYDGNTEIIELFGKVYVYDPKNKRKLWGEYVKLFLENDTLEAKNAVMEVITKK
jgi:lipopolysaccharide export system protein LptA